MKDSINKIQELFKDKTLTEKKIKELNNNFSKSFEMFDEMFDQVFKSQEEKKAEESVKNDLQCTEDEKYINIPYDKIQEGIDKLTEQYIKPSGEEYDLILCITRGGLIPAGMLAYSLGIKDIVNINVSSYDGEEQGELKIKDLSKKDKKLFRNAKKILIVDDIIDSGNTINSVYSYLLSDVCVSGTTISEIFNITSIFSIVSKKLELNSYCIYDMTKTDKWIKFPWDK